MVGEAQSAEAAIEAAEKLQPAVILLDNHMPGLTGIAAIGGLKKTAPECHILMLTVSEKPDDLAAALKGGAAGYLLKTINTEDLADSVEKIVQGDTIISPEMMTKLVGLLRDMPDTMRGVESDSNPSSVAIGAPFVRATDAAAILSQDSSARLSSPDTSHISSVPRVMVHAKDPILELSPRETEILRLIAQGDSNKMIARALDIAETTVKIHVQHILRKLNLSTRVHAAVYAATRGL